MKTRLNQHYYLERDDAEFIPVIERLEFVMRNLIQVVELLAQGQKENGIQNDNS